VPPVEGLAFGDERQFVPACGERVGLGDGDADPAGHTGVFEQVGNAKWLHAGERASHSTRLESSR